MRITLPVMAPTCLTLPGFEVCRPSEPPFTWARYGGYEVSTRGDRRFSAFVARLPEGRTLEEVYQCDVKGYDPGGTQWRLGKGKPPLLPVDLWPAYLALWRRWAVDNAALMAELRLAANRHGNTLSDRFATSPVNQAHALAQLLTEGYGRP